MTEQPVETRTEQQFLGNHPPARLEDAILLTFAGKPLDDNQMAVLDKAVQSLTPNQSYVRNAHRLPIRKLTPPARDNTTVVILFNKSVTAAAQLLQAKEASKRAEDALSEALAVETLRDVDSVEADRKLLEFVREVAAQ